MGFIKNQLLKVIEWEDNTNNTMAYKYPIPPKTEIMMGSQLIVRESQVAILVSSGKIADVFEPGRYKLETGNMPILTKLMSWKYGFNSPFVCDVYFINTKQFLNQKWGTSNPVTMRDQDFGVVQFRGFGIYSFRVKNPVVFLREVLGSADFYKVDTLQEHLKRTIVSGISEAVAASNIPMIDLATRLSDLGDKAGEITKDKFDVLGIDLVSLVIENLSLTEESSKALSERTRMNILGNAQEYTQFAAADALKTVAENAHKGGMNMAGTTMQMGAGWAIGTQFGNAINPNNFGQGGATPYAAPVVPPSNTIVCPACSANIIATSKFCPECGAKIPNYSAASSNNVCKCGKVNRAGAKFCAECGSKL